MKRAVHRQAGPRVYVGVLGCKLNQCEAEGWVRDLAENGYRVVQKPQDADLHVINTCAVTQEAARKSRQLIRRCFRDSGGAAVIATGCYADRMPEQVAELPGITVVLDNSHKDKAVAVALDHLRALRPRHSQRRLPPSCLRTRALVKIQDGCDNSCSYCIVRLARGPYTSRPLADIVRDVAARHSEGAQEVILTGVHIGAYGRDIDASLPSLVETILEEVPIPRLRLSSIEPWDVSPRLFALWRDSRLCRHLHLPLQSGCDATLRRMKRRYTTGQFDALVSSARRMIPDVAITTDIIVGFPGEGQSEFAEGAAFVQRLGFARVHVFPYSSRPGTVAAKLPAQIPVPERRRRARLMRAIGSRSSLAFRKGMIGREVHVLWESADHTTWQGLTDNYIRVRTHSEETLYNRNLLTRLVAVSGHGMLGELLP